MSDDFEKNLRDHLHREAEDTREFPRRLRGRIRDGIAPRVRAGMAPQLALAGALVLVAVAVLAVRNPTILNVVTTGIKTFFVPTPTPAPQPFLCQDQSGGSTGGTATLTNIRPASHASDGYDRAVFDFSGDIPSWDLTRQESATFVRDASGQQVTLDGSSGLKLVLRGADVASVAPTDLHPAFPSIRQITQIGNFERVVTYGIGLSSSQCVRVLQLSNSRLVIDVATTGSASTTAASTPLPTQPAPTDLGAFSCVDHSGGSNSGPAMQLTAVRVAHQSAGYDRIVFEFAPQAGATAHLPAYTVSRQASAKFVKDPSGLPVTMRGSSGLRIVFQGASATNYSGSRDQTYNLPVVQEVGQLGDFEAVVSWGAGLSQPSCIRMLELTNPTRLAIDVQAP